jgi:hypothetical protein
VHLLSDGIVRSSAEIALAIAADRDAVCMMLWTLWKRGSIAREERRTCRVSGRGRPFVYAYGRAA